VGAYSTLQRQDSGESGGFGGVVRRISSEGHEGNVVVTGRGSNGGGSSESL